jgi:hypothetical protein
MSSARTRHQHGVTTCAPLQLRARRITPATSNRRPHPTPSPLPPPRPAHPPASRGRASDRAATRRPTTAFIGGKWRRGTSTPRGLHHPPATRYSASWSLAHHERLCKPATSCVVTQGNGMKSGPRKEHPAMLCGVHCTVLGAVENPWFHRHVPANSPTGARTSAAPRILNLSMYCYWPYARVAKDAMLSSCS